MVKKRTEKKKAVREPATAPHRHHDELLTEELLDFLALVSHQLRTPLTIIKGYIAMLLEGTFGQLSPEQKKVFEKIYTADERMIRLVNNFLDLPRMHLGMMPLRHETLSLTDVLTRVIAEARLQADIKKLPIAWSGVGGASCLVQGDRENLMQAFSNILDNAIKYTSTGSIMVSLNQQNNGCRVIITDTGQGITKKDLPVLFDKFMRGEDIRKLYREGRGLGLYIAKQIVLGHRGKIWAESEGIGKGSKFIVELPAKS